MKVVWLRNALRNLEKEAEYIARSNPRAAVRAVQRIRQSVMRLAEHPEIGRPGRVLGTRELVIPGLPYIVPYRVRQSRVEVLRVLHTRRKWPEGFPEG